MQGYDAVAMEIDVQIGGRDQTFNILQGVMLAKRYLEKRQWGVTTKLIEDPAGRKMGKTEGNIVAIDGLPEVKYEAMMTWPDGAVPLGFELLTRAPMSVVRRVAKEVKARRVHPMDFKQALAHRVVSELDGESQAGWAEEEFDRVHRQGRLPRNILEVRLSPGLSLPEVLVRAGLAADEADAEQKIASRAVLVDGQKVKASLEPRGDFLVQIGKRTIGRIRKVMIG